MEILASIFKLFAGIGLFLFAMYLIEESLKNLSGRNFKLFLQKVTKNRLGAVTGGAIITGILQSSSMVSLMVLAFVGAGVFTIRNAMAIILGTNLGTTLDSWLVATLGFNMNIEVIAYPSVFMGGLLLIVLGKRKSIKYISYFLLGFGLLFIGLAFMKTAMETQVKAFDFSHYATMPLIIFIVIGFIITLLVQSSSVTMALTLSALHVQAISFPMAATIVLGSETGTTIKIMLSAIGGNATKKRVVLGNLIFNVVITIFAFASLKLILLLIVDVFKIKNTLIGLVAFSTIVNLLGIIIFLPLLNPFTKFLEFFFKDKDGSATTYIKHANINELETALDLFRRETAYFIHNSMLFNLIQFETEINLIENNSEYKIINENRKFYIKTTDEQYNFLHQLHGELQSFYLRLQTKLENEKYAELHQLIAAANSAMYSIKSMKDVKSNMTNLSSSSKDIKFNFFINHKNKIESLYIKLNTALEQSEKSTIGLFKNMYYDIQNDYSSSLQNFYKEARTAPIDDDDITTIINFNRELFTSNKAILMALKAFVLREKEAKDFNEVLEYTT